MSDQPFTIFIDDVRYEFNGRFITGESVAALVNARDRNVYFDVSPEARDMNIDWLISGPQSLRGIELKGGERFYTAPRGSYVR